MNVKILLVSGFALLLLLSSCNLLEDLETSMALNETEDTSQPQSFICATATYMESMPRFPGGSMALLKYVIEHVQLPTIPLHQIEGGKLVIQFIVECDGKISSSKIVKGIHPEIDAAYLRVFEQMPAWEPGRQREIPTRTQMSFPIHIRFE